MTCISVFLPCIGGCGISSNYFAHYRLNQHLIRCVLVPAPYKLHENYWALVQLCSFASIWSKSLPKVTSAILSHITFIAFRSTKLVGGVMNVASLSSLVDRHSADFPRLKVLRNVVKSISPNVSYSYQVHQSVFEGSIPDSSVSMLDV